jgi:hypothetical protein
LGAPWKWTCYTDGYLLERRPNLILVHLGPIPSPEAATGSTDVAHSAISLNIVSCLEPIVPLPKLIQDFVHIQVTS